MALFLYFFGYFAGCSLLLALAYRFGIIVSIVAAGRKINSIKIIKATTTNKIEKTNEKTARAQMNRKTEIALNQGYWTCYLNDYVFMFFYDKIALIVVSPNKVNWKLSLNYACKSHWPMRVSEFVVWIFCAFNGGIDCLQWPGCSHTITAPNCLETHTHTRRERESNGESERENSMEN